METVQIQCGSCNKLMAISMAHLGGQVRCPHCQAVVQAPPRTAGAASAPTEVLPPSIEPREADSIFAPPEASEDLFDAGPRGPLVEMPADMAAAPPAAQHAVTIDAPSPLSQAITEVASAPAPHVDAPAAEADADLTRLQRPRPTVDRGYWSLMLLIFLVPYSILMTLFVVYLWHQLDQANKENQLRMLPDPAPKKDGARTVFRTPHDGPLADNQKVTLGGQITIGAIQVTPEKVTRDETTGDLELVLNVKNVSANQAFSPLHMDFLRGTKPYTFLESKSKTLHFLYGGRVVEFERPGDDGNKTNEGELKPGEQEKVWIIAPHNEKLVQRIVESKENLTWRVQLRRGLVSVGGQQVSATAVIGVQFNASEIR